MFAPIRRAAPVTNANRFLDFDSVLTETTAMSSDPRRAILPEPPDDLKQLSDALVSLIRAEIRERGPIPFSRYMERVLYEPGLGYYSAGLRKFGADGDFVTAPELGPVFAQCLARQAAQVGGALGDWTLLEVGAGTGKLAVDLLAEIEPDSRPGQYLILERSAHLRAVQHETIKNSGLAQAVSFEWLDQPPQQAWQGVLIANEVMDALPVERFELTAGSVHRLCVAAGENGFEWARKPAPEALAAAVHGITNSLSSPLPDGYRSEVCLMLDDWLKGLTSRMTHGLALFIDYGYPRSAYYAPERPDGTLVCHYRHRGHDDPFFWPGLQDISAFVDFTALAEAAGQCGLEVSGYDSQSGFLIGCGLDQVLAGIESLPDRQRLARAAEVRDLVMPGAMGEKFEVMALSRDLDLPLIGFGGGRLDRL